MRCAGQPNGRRRFDSIAAAGPVVDDTLPLIAVQTWLRHENSPMSHTLCRFCGQANPPESKFCNGCGGQLNLAPCPRCGAVNEVTATSCHECSGELAGNRADRPDLEPAPSHAVQAHGAPPQDAGLGENAIAVSERGALRGRAVPRPRFRRRSRAILGAVALATIGALGYAVYGPRAPADAPVSPVGIRADSPVRPIVRQPATQGTQAVEPEKSVGLAGRVAPAGMTAASEAPVGGTETADAAVPCTDGIVALGLCASAPARNKEAIAAGPAAHALPQSDSAAATCTEAAGALALCAPEPGRKAE